MFTNLECRLEFGVHLWATVVSGTNGICKTSEDVISTIKDRLSFSSVELITELTGPTEETRQRHLVF